MDPEPRQEFTDLLLAWGKGDRSALDRLIPLIHAELHRLAKRYMRAERAGHTLQTTALVNEVYLRLVNSSQVRWKDRAHFLAVAAQLMRRVLVDLARRRDYQKRGGGAIRVSLDESLVVVGEGLTDLVAIHEALGRLEEFSPMAAQVVELKFFGGLQGEEIAEVMGISTARVTQYWNFAKAWLRRSLSGQGEVADGNREKREGR